MGVWERPASGLSDPAAESVHDQAGQECESDLALFPESLGGRNPDDREGQRHDPEADCRAVVDCEADRTRSRRLVLLRAGGQELPAVATKGLREGEKRELHHSANAVGVAGLRVPETSDRT